MKNSRTYDISKEFYRKIELVEWPPHLRDQALRAASSIVLNVAEGAGLPSKKEKAIGQKVKISIFFWTIVIVSCTHGRPTPYESAIADVILSFKRLPIPLPAGTVTKVHQGAFGQSSHNEHGNQYNWDFEVPIGTPVLAVADGVVSNVWQPSIGGCDSKYMNSANVLQNKLGDATIAQYLHTETTLVPGDHVKKGQTIAHTAISGWLCYPHVHFGVYASERQLYASPDRKTIPISFVGIPDGIAREGGTYVVP